MSTLPTLGQVLLKLSASRERMRVPQSRSGRRPMSVDTLLRKDKEGTLFKESAFAEKIPGGLSSGKSPSDFPKALLAKGTEVELEHTSSKGVATEIAMDHLTEDPKYYDKLEKIEKKAYGEQAMQKVLRLVKGMQIRPGNTAATSNGYHALNNGVGNVAIRRAQELATLAPSETPMIEEHLGRSVADLISLMRPANRIAVPKSGDSARFVTSLGKKNQWGLPTPKTPAGRKALDAVIKGHELAELQVKPTYEGFATHLSPDVLLREHNMVTTLPGNAAEAGNTMRALRYATGESDVFRNATGLEFGQGGRFSRHARKHLSGLLQEESNKLAYTLQGHTSFQGIPISIENAKGSVRKGTDPDGKEWKTVFKLPYGYITGTKGADGEGIDAYVGPDKKAPNVYVVHQRKITGKGYDEDKVFFGMKSEEDTRKAYLAHYDDAGPKLLGPISTMSVDALKGKLDKSREHTKLAWDGVGSGSGPTGNRMAMLDREEQPDRAKSGDVPSRDGTSPGAAVVVRHESGPDFMTTIPTNGAMASSGTGATTRL